MNRYSHDDRIAPTGWFGRRERAVWLAMGLVGTIAAFALSAHWTHATRMVVREEGLTLVILAAIPALCCWLGRAGRIVFVIWSVLVACVVILSFGSAFWPLIMGGCGIVAFSAPRPRWTRRSATVVFASVAVGAALVIVTAYAFVPYGSAHFEDIPTAGTRISNFFEDVARGRDPKIQGGEPVADRFGSAYQQLCSDIQQQVSEQRFRDTRGEAVSEALTTTGYSGDNRVGDYEVVGVDVQHRDWPDTLDQNLTSTWQNAALDWQTGPDGHTPVANTRIQIWRVDLIREDGVWRVCGLTKTSNSPKPPYVGGP